MVQIVICENDFRQMLVYSYYNSMSRSAILNYNNQLAFAYRFLKILSYHLIQGAKTQFSDKEIMTTCLV